MDIVAFVLEDEFWRVVFVTVVFPDDKLFVEFPRMAVELLFVSLLAKGFCPSVEFADDVKFPNDIVFVESLDKVEFSGVVEFNGKIEFSDKVEFFDV
ncbi:MAG TPA: hypothetical protein VLT10_00335 [Verrucomicrobiae bacterium]|nr:hypothetical protein [Verrucomicrobiae bacterium]